VDFLAALHAKVEAGYPRPRLVRDRWVDLSGAWEFAFDDEDLGRDAGWHRPSADVYDRTIYVPYPFESDRSGIGGEGFHPVVWYRRAVVLPTHRSDERVMVHFGAVDYAASVWVDGQLLGEHSGGHTPFSFLLPADSTGEASIVVRAEDRPEAVELPRGKQDWRRDPHSIWYGRTTGIWQPVWIEVVPSAHLLAADFVCDAAQGRVDWSVRLSRPIEGSVRLRLSADGVLVGEQSQRFVGSETRAAMSLAGLENAWEWENLEWSPEHPRLIGAEITLLDAAGAVVDSVLSYLGSRSVAVADGQFLLNRRPYVMRLVLAQGYWPDTRLASPTREALRKEVELIKSLGFNGARIHQKLEDPLFLYWCDRLGLLVWEEMPSAGAFSAGAIHRLVQEWLEALARDRGHPCIVVWVPFNESWGVPAMASRPEQAALVSGLADLTRAFDPSRLVVSNDGWEHVNSDLLTIHDYSPDGDSLVRRYGDAAARRATLEGAWPSVRALVLPSADARGLPVVLSEFGGVALSATADDAWHGYSDVGDPKDLLERLGDLFGALERCEGLAGFCYTQLSDTDQESNGLTWPDRTPKLAPEDIATLVEGRRRP
jgi:beta-galactosidase/beta-glucuronidase